MLSTGYYYNVCNKALNPVHDLNDVLLFAFSNYSRSLPIEFEASRLLRGGRTVLIKWPAFRGCVTVLPQCTRGGESCNVGLVGWLLPNDL